MIIRLNSVKSIEAVVEFTGSNVTSNEDLAMHAVFYAAL